MQPRTLICIFLFIVAPILSGAQTFELSGTISDEKTAEALTGVIIALEGTPYHAITDENGHYSLQAPAGNYTLVIQYSGYVKTSQAIQLSKNQKLSVKLKANPVQLKDVVVNAENQQPGISQASGVQSGTLQISGKQIKALPSLAGEQDVIKALQLMPGVKKGTDGGSAILVRGGNNDQNLFLLDDAVIYNPAHALSLFSVFNTDALLDAKLLKGPFPAQYQGRLSSITELRTRDGNSNKKRVEASAGSLSARISMDGPLDSRGKMTYMVSFRRSYLDQTMKLARLNVPYYFMDMNARLAFKVNTENKISLSIYKGIDVLKSEELSSPNREDLVSSSGTRFNNQAVSLQWHGHYGKISHSSSLVHSAYRFSVGGAFSGNSISASSGISDLGIKSRWTYDKSARLQLQWGASSLLHAFEGTSLVTSGEQIPNANNHTKPVSALESAVYGSLLYKLDEKWQLSPGLAMSSFSSGKTAYIRPEPRIMLSYVPSEKSTWKAGYSRMVQYIHTVSSSSFALPTDVWYPAGDTLKPAYSDQVSLSWFGKKGIWTLSTEAYYKFMNHASEFAEGKGVQLRIPAASEVNQGRAKAWGLECMLQGSGKKWDGWLAYTLSWTKRQFDSVNAGNYYYARYDRRHDVSANFNYRFNERWSLGAVWVYATGARFTPQTGSYYVLVPGNTLGPQEVPVYGAINSAKFIASHRLDLNLTYKKEGRNGRKTEWQLGTYNTYNRAQPYKVSVRTNPDGTFTYRQIGLLGFTPYISYHIIF